MPTQNHMYKIVYRGKNRIKRMLKNKIIGQVKRSVIDYCLFHKRRNINGIKTN